MAAGTIGITTTFSVTTASTQVCLTNTLRRGVRIENISATSTMNFGFGTGNAVTTGMHVLATSSAVTFGPNNPNTTGQISNPSNVPSGDLALIALTTTGNAVVTEW
jgi:hypothetical protein